VSRAFRQLNSVVVFSIREPFEVGVRGKMRMRIKGHQTDVAYLRGLQIGKDLAGDVFIHKRRIAKRDELALDLSFEITAQKEVNRPDRRKRDPTDDTSGGAIVQEAVFDPATVAELLCHNSK